MDDYSPGQAITEVLHINFNMGTWDLPDMYSRSPRALGIHSRQIPHVHVTTIICNTFTRQIKGAAQATFHM